MTTNTPPPANNSHSHVHSLRNAVFMGLAGLMFLALLLGAFGMREIHALNRQFTNIQSVSLPKVEMAREMRGAGYARMIHLLRMSAQTDVFERDMELTRFRDEGARFTRAREALSRLPMTPVETRKFESLLLTVRDISTTQDEIADLLMAERDNEAKSLLVGRAIQLQDKVITELANFVALQTRAMAKSEQDVSQHYQQSMVVMTGAAVFALLLGGAVILRVTRTVGKQEDKIQDEIHEAEFAAEHDPLTGLANRRGFEPRLQGLIANQRLGLSHSLLMMDLDGFKRVNDTAGHAAGDALLQALAKLFVASVRGRDVVARLGGDEFAFILINTSAESALKVAENIRASVKGFSLEWEGERYQVGASIGVVEIGSQDRDAVALMKRADAACYEAKQNGRNQVRRAA